MAEPRLGTQEQPEGTELLPGGKRSQNPRTPASSTCTEWDRAGAGGPCWPAFPECGCPVPLCPTLSPSLTTGPSGDSRKIPQGTPTCFQTASALPVPGGSHGPQGCLTSTCVGDAAHRPSTSVSSPQRSSGLGSAAGLSVSSWTERSQSEWLLWAALQKDVDVASPHVACGKGRTLDPGTRHTLNPRAHTLKASVM